MSSIDPSPTPARSHVKLRERSTDTPLEMPSAARAFTLLGRAVRLRCPHCGVGPVMTWRGTVRPRCSGCHFRFERSDENYFSGAMFFGLLGGELIFAVSLLIVLLIMWPNVPWDTLMWAMPTGMVLVLIFFVPISKALWLTVDVLVRPVQPDELV